MFTADCRFNSCAKAAPNPKPCVAFTLGAESGKLTLQLAQACDANTVHVPDCDAHNVIR